MLVTTAVSTGLWFLGRRSSIIKQSLRFAELLVDKIAGLKVLVLLVRLQDATRENILKKVPPNTVLVQNGNSIEQLTMVDSVPYHTSTVDGFQALHKLSLAVGACPIKFGFFVYYHWVTCHSW